MQFIGLQGTRVSARKFAQPDETYWTERVQHFDVIHWHVATTEFSNKCTGGSVAIDSRASHRSHRPQIFSPPVSEDHLVDESDELMPERLKMVKGIFEDSENLPWSIFRETLQQNMILCVIKMNLLKKRFETLADIAAEKDDYKSSMSSFE